MTPELRRIFRHRIDVHVLGMMAGSAPARRDVVKIAGDITDKFIVVTYRDGHVETYSGGGYAEHKRNGCYSPLMPRRVP